MLFSCNLADCSSNLFNADPPSPPIFLIANSKSCAFFSASTNALMLSFPKLTTSPTPKAKPNALPISSNPVFICDSVPT